MSPVVALLTDFGERDSYVAELKLAARRAVPSVQLVDVAHALEAFDLRAAALVAERVWLALERNAALVVVVDPGVGSARQALAVRARGRWLVGPDNGVLPDDGRGEVWALGPSRFAPRAGQSTFDGRELFAPVAALLAAGMRPELLASRATRAVPWLLARRTVVQPGGEYTGAVIALDRYGNAVTDLVRGDGDTVIEVLEPAPWRGGLRASYASVQAAEPVALWGSSGRLELARRQSPSGLTVGELVSVIARSLG